MAIGTIIAGITTGSKAINAIKGILGKNESPAGLNRRRIQAELVSRGYPYFTKMHGWHGNEKRKSEAMATILAAVENYPGAAQAIRGKLNNNGRITPETIEFVNSRYPLQEISAAPQPAPAAAATTTTAQQSAVVNKNWLIGGGIAAALAIIAILALK